MRSILNLYLSRQLIVALFVTAPSLCALIALLQAMRLLPLIAAADVTVAEVGRVIGLLLVPFTAIALPAAAVLSLLMVLARLESDGELLAFRASGASTARLAVAPVIICTVVSLCAGGMTLFAEPAAYNGLQGDLGDLLLRSTLGRIRPGVFVEPTPELTILIRERSGRSLSGVFIDDRRQERGAQLMARSATFAPVENQSFIHVVLQDGTVRSRSADGLRVHATFRRLETSFPLGDAAETISTIVPSRFGRDPWQLSRDARGSDRATASAAALLLHRRLSLAPGALGLCLFILALGLVRPIATRPWAVTVGAAAILIFHLVARLGEAFVEANVCGPATGGWLPTLLCWSSFIAVVLLRRAY